MMFLFALSLAVAQPDQYQERTFVIAASEKSFSQAMQKAAKLSEQTGLLLDMRGVIFDPQHTKTHGGGLTLPASDCEGNNWGYPCYVARGAWDSGDYISVEHTSAISGFTPGLYVVIASTGSKEAIQPTLKKVRQFIPDAYPKTTEVYVGCMH